MSRRRLESPFLTALLVLASLMCAAPARASQIVIPAALADAEGNASTNSGLVGSLRITWQMQISAAELSTLGLSTGDEITGVRGRLDGGGATGPASEITVPDLEFTMARAANSVDSMSTNFANNMTDPVLVRDGTYTLPANSMPGGSTPNAFGALIAFDIPYTYQGGDLIFMFRRLEAASLIHDNATIYPGAGIGRYRSVMSGGVTSTTGIVSNNMPALQFEVIPEPSAVVLMAMGCSGLLTRRRRRR